MKMMMDRTMGSKGKVATRIRTHRRPTTQDPAEAQKKKLRHRVIWRAYFIMASVIMVFTIGVIGFMYLEPDMNPLKAFHLTMQTITTVGYGDVQIQTEGGRLFSDILMIVGLAIATVGIASLLEFIVSGKLREVVRTRDYEEIMRRMRNHVIVCGYGRVGRAAADELVDKGVPIVILEKYKEVLDELDPSIPREEGDSTQDEELLKCGVKRAIAVIAASGSDADNLMTIVTAKYIRPDIIAIARSSVDEDKMKFQMVGADMVVSPEVEGGKSMARMLKDAQSHIIVAGYGRVGSAATRELRAMGKPVTVLERDLGALDHVPTGVKVVEGDVELKEYLIQAGVDKATAIIPACGADASNLLATVTAKYYKPSITVISRASSPEDVGKMLKVGADIVISPEVEGGKSMADWAAQAYRLVKGEDKK